MANSSMKSMLARTLLGSVAMDRPRPRRARPLLLAGAGLAATLMTGCAQQQPMGNLKAPDCDLGQCEQPADLVVPPVDMVDADAPFGNLKPPEDIAAPQPGDGGVTDG